MRATNEAVVAAGADRRDAAVAAQGDDATAEVAAQDDGLEAAVALSPMALAEIRVTQRFALNNVALKWIRENHEFPPGYPTVGYVELTDEDPLITGVLERTHGGPYRFITGLQQPWSWREMIAGMSPRDQDAVLGANPRLGVARIACASIVGSYDHMRAKQMRLQTGAPVPVELPVWDFFVTRTDGTTVRFHPTHGSKRIMVSDASSPYGLTGPPLRGNGESDERGTYRSETIGNYQLVVRRGVGAAGSGRTDELSTESPVNDIHGANERMDALEEAQLQVTLHASAIEVQRTLGSACSTLKAANPNVELATGWDEIPMWTSEWWKSTAEFQVLDDTNTERTCKWCFTPEHPRKRNSGVSGWASVDGEMMRLHVCAFSPCIARHAANKYGNVPAPLHCRRVAQ